MQDSSGIEKIDIDKIKWRTSDDFFESLGEALDILDEKAEKYDFTWVGKRKAIIEAGAPLNKTFRPNVDASKNWDSTENLFIEGDNLEALKLLQESYLGKVKLIYIDPPYNTGGDFLYLDDFSTSVEQYNEDTEYKDNEGNIQFKKNEKTNGRYHSDWLSMMYPRLKLARNLLANDGVIFISIDDNEMANLKKLCDEVFGEDNFVNCIAVKMSEISGVKMNHAWSRFPKLKEYVLFYKKEAFQKFELIDKYKIDKWDYENNIFLDGLDIEGRQKLIALEESEKTDLTIDKQINDIYAKVKIVSLSQKMKELGVDQADEKWLFDNSYRIIKTAGSSSLAKLVKSFENIPNQDIAAARSTNGVLFYYITSFNRETKQPRLQVIFADSNIDKNPGDFWQDIKTTGAIALEGGIGFENGKKPLKLLRRIIRMTVGPSDTVLDFFAGSSSTAHAVMQLNAEDGGKRKWIMVQLNEKTDEKSEAYKAGYKTIPEISRERIRHAGNKLATEHNEANVDYGYRSLTIADTNYKEVYRPAGELQQSTLLDVVDNIKVDRSDLDLLYGVLTHSALELNRSMEKREILGNEVYLYDYFGELSGLISCFSSRVTEESIKEIAKLKPLTAVFRDSTFDDSQAKVNLAEHFRILSPETKVKVI